MTKTFPKKGMIWFLFYALLFAGIAVFLLNPTLKNIEKNKKEIVTEQKTLTANYDEIASLQKISKDKVGFDEIKNTVFGYLPATLNSSQFIVEVEGLAKRTDITVNSVSMSAASSSVVAEKTTAKTTDETTKTETTKTDTTKKKTKGGIQKNEFSLTTKADFAKTMSFIAQMEKLSRFNSITSLSVASAENGGADVKITGNIFYEQQ